MKKVLEDACERGSQGISYSVKNFEEVRQQGEVGAAVIINYRTDDGASNEFGLDIVYGIPASHTEMLSPIHSAPKIVVATVENIVADKLASVQRFKGGNTRMKDYDDLWRLANTSTSVDRVKLMALLKARSIVGAVDATWIGPEMIRVWAAHQKRYGDLPVDLQLVFSHINRWLRE